MKPTFRLEAIASHTCDNAAECTPGKKTPSASRSADLIIWQGEAVELEGQPVVVTPGMRGEVISLHDGFHLDVIQGEPIPPKARVRFDSGMDLMVDERMSWEKAT